MCSHYRAGSGRGGWLDANWQVATQIISLRKSYIISKHLQILLPTIYPTFYIVLCTLGVRGDWLWNVINSEVGTLDSRFLSIAVGSKIWFLTSGRKWPTKIIEVFSKKVLKKFSRNCGKEEEGGEWWRFSVAGMSCWRLYGPTPIEKKDAGQPAFLEARL